MEPCVTFRKLKSQMPLAVRHHRIEIMEAIGDQHKIALFKRSTNQCTFEFTRKDGREDLPNSVVIITIHHKVVVSDTGRVLPHLVIVADYPNKIDTSRYTFGQVQGIVEALSVLQKTCSEYFRDLQLDRENI